MKSQTNVQTNTSEGKLSKIKNIIQKVKQFILRGKGQTKQKKLDIILDHLIESVEVRNNDVIITTKKKNIGILVNGHLVQLNTGSHVMISKEIHLNPKIKFNKDESFDKLQGSLDEARKTEAYKIKKKVENFQEEDGCHGKAINKEK